VYRFGNFELNGAGRELRSAGESVHLEPQAFDLLCYLVEHRDRVVDKIELLDRVWGHTFLSEANLTTRIKEIRRALGDDGRRQHTIRNVRGRGYRFVGAGVDDSTADGFTSASRLIGRGADLATVLAALSQSRLVTLTGAGGVGKSTLARAAAAERDGAYPDGIHLLELATVASGEHALPAVARALDIVLDSDRPDDAVRSIARLDTLLLLDNCEHLIDDVAHLVDRILGLPGGRVRVLATSQVRLGLSDEIVISVAPLTIEQAIQLFRARAVAAVPSWDPDAVGEDRIERLISSLDRLPLTIEMAAGRIASMTFDDLDRAIAKRLPLLQMSHRTPAHRHRSLESLVTWSAELLDPRDREIFTRFSVFAGPVTAADAGAVLVPDAPDSAALDLARLAERSLLNADRGRNETRYSMFTTVRTVAEHWLGESGSAALVRREYAEYVAEVLRAIDDQIRTPDEAEGRRRLDGLVAETRAAHQWAQRSDPQLASRMSGSLFHAAYSSLWLEPAEWSRALLARNPTRGADQFPGATLMAAAAAAHRGELTFARERAEEVAAAGAGRMRANAIELLADVALYEGDLDGAARAALELQRLGAELGDSHAAAFGVVDAALARVYGGDAPRALDHLEHADLGDLAPTDRAWLAYARGDALIALDDRGAANAFLEAIELGGSVGNRFVMSVSRTSLAIEHTRGGEFDLAFEAFHDSLHDYMRHGNFTHAVTAMRNLIGLLARVGDDCAATLLAGATSDERLRVSYGVEAEQISDVLDQIARRVGSSQFDTWFSDGQRFESDNAVRLAMELVAVHRS
jgi:predicted ATPase/DNA-binding winged helix-turn-helix (wHTH) protein